MSDFPLHDLLGSVKELERLAKERIALARAGGPPKTDEAKPNYGILWTTREYPCGCTAYGSGDVPNYCPEHGTYER